MVNRSALSFGMDHWDVLRKNIFISIFPRNWFIHKFGYKKYNIIFQNDVESNYIYSDIIRS